jgi:alkaline phosphatase
VAEDAIAVGSGPGSEALKGFQDNTEIFRIVHKEL